MHCNNTCQEEYYMVNWNTFLLRHSCNFYLMLFQWVIFLVCVKLVAYWYYKGMWRSINDKKIWAMTTKLKGERSSTNMWNVSNCITWVSRYELTELNLKVAQVKSEKSHHHYVLRGNYWWTFTEDSSRPTRRLRYLDLLWRILVSMWADYTNGHSLNDPFCPMQHLHCWTCMTCDSTHKRDGRGVLNCGF